jgi:hypothetical protein
VEQSREIKKMDNNDYEIARRLARAGRARRAALRARRVDDRFDTSDVRPSRPARPSAEYLDVSDGVPDVVEDHDTLPVAFSASRLADAN